MAPPVVVFFGVAIGIGLIMAAATVYYVEHSRQEPMKYAHTTVTDAKRKLRKRDEYEFKRRLQQLQNGIDECRKQKEAIQGTSNLKFNTFDDDVWYDAESTLNDDYESTQVDNNSLDLILETLDKKLDLGNIEDIEEALQKLEDICLEYPKNADILYRIGKAYHKIADQSDDKEFVKEKLAKLAKGINACESALSIAPNHAEIHKWYAALIGTRSQLVSHREQIDDAHLFKKHVDIAISINPKDYLLHYMLGRFEFVVAGLTWYERCLARALFGEPPNATYEDACCRFIEAEKLCNFEWMENRLMIGKCKIAMGKYREAREWLKKAIRGRAISLNAQVRNEIDALLEKCSKNAQ